jgi:hypothetical protein
MTRCTPYLRRFHRVFLSIFLCLCFEDFFRRHFFTLPTGITPLRKRGLRYGPFEMSPTLLLSPSIRR